MAPHCRSCWRVHALAGATAFTKMIQTSNQLAPSMSGMVQAIPLKIIVGAGSTSQPDWRSFEFQELDIRKRVDWLRWFEPNTLDAVLSEHVLEHLETDDARTTAANIYAMLK